MFRDPWILDTPTRPARPPRGCDGREWRRYRIALDRYERETLAYRKARYL